MYYMDRLIIKFKKFHEIYLNIGLNFRFINSYKGKYQDVKYKKKIESYNTLSFNNWNNEKTIWNIER